MKGKPLTSKDLLTLVHQWHALYQERYGKLRTDGDLLTPHLFTLVKKAVHSKKKPERVEGYLAGLEAAASFVESGGFDPLVDHDYRLSDCIRAKFALIPKKKMRPRPVRKSAPS